MTIEVPKTRHQETMLRYQKMGWTQIGFQEMEKSTGLIQPKGKKKPERVALGEPYVNVTFERNTGEANFNQLDRIYKEYRRMEEDYQKKEAEWTRTALSVARLWKLTGLFALIVFPFDIAFCADCDWGLFPVFIALTLDYTVSMLVGGLILNPIVGFCKKSRAKRHYAPLIQEYEEKMTALANEAEKYLV